MELRCFVTYLWNDPRTCSGVWVMSLNYCVKVQLFKR